MQQDFINHANEIRLIVFIATLLAMASLESLIAFREYLNLYTRFIHFSHNFLLSLVNTFILRFVLPSGLVGIALFAETYELGLFNRLTINLLAEFILSLVLLDLCIYWQHRLMHKVPILWKLHGVHHSDQTMDVSTGFRFHPLEMLFSFAFKIGLVLTLGISPLAIIVFEILLSSFALFSHSNIVFPKKVEKLLHSFWVTPAIHRIHHSVNLSESNRNFSFSLNCWDKLFGSYQEPTADQNQIVFGWEKNHRRVQSTSLPTMLSEPFRK